MGGIPLHGRFCAKLILKMQSLIFFFFKGSNSTPKSPNLAKLS